jgi:hypothetical protein
MAIYDLLHQIMRRRQPASASTATPNSSPEGLASLHGVVVKLKNFQENAAQL